MTSICLLYNNPHDKICQKDTNTVAAKKIKDAMWWHNLPMHQLKELTNSRNISGILFYCSFCNEYKDCGVDRLLCLRYSSHKNSMEVSQFPYVYFVPKSVNRPISSTDAFFDQLIVFFSYLVPKVLVDQFHRQTLFNL